MARARRTPSAHASPVARTEAGQGLGIVIVAEHALVAQAVRVALTGRGHAVFVVRPPAHSGARRGSRRSWGRVGDAAAPPEVGILLAHGSGLYSVATGAILEQLTIPWLVLASEERGPAWGAHYAGGASLVVPPSTSLDDVCLALADLAAGRRPSMPRGRRELVSAWRQTLLERNEINDRISSLTVRERQVLRQLHEGVGVRSIAQGAEVAEATVRTQVKAILRKLDVSSQIAAVAAYAQLQRDPAARQ